MSNRAATLGCSGYFLGCLWPCLTRAKEAKHTESDWAAGFIRGVFAVSASVWDVFAGDISMEGVSAWGICIGTRLSSTGPWL